MAYKNDIEIQISNVTPSQFLAYVRSRCKKKNIPAEIMETVEFANMKVESMGDPVHGHDEWKFDFWYTRPYSYQTCSIKQDESSGFNEICEFDFDNDKKGHGYYYFVDWDKTAETAY